MWIYLVIGKVQMQFLFKKNKKFKRVIKIITERLVNINNRYVIRKYHKGQSTNAFG